MEFGDMTSQTEDGTDRGDPDLAVVMSERTRLINLGYRILGSLADAEDVVQETYARWYAMSAQQQQAIESPGAWLTKVATRLCLDVLRSARVRRERYVGEWLPEPLPATTGGGAHGSGDIGTVDPADRVSLDESVSMAFLVVLDAMTPAERVAFVLHDVFQYPFSDVAAIVGRTPAACRQLASSARGRIRASQPTAAPAMLQTDVVRKFRQAWEASDVPALISLLDPDVTAVSDGGGFVAALGRIEGDVQVAHAFAGLVAVASDVHISEQLVNGQPGLVVRHADGAINTVMAFHVVNGRIAHIWTVRNPDKLRYWTGKSR